MTSPASRAPAEDPRRPIKTLEVVVSRTIEEAHDTRTLHLALGPEQVAYEPGYFLTIEPHQFEFLSSFIDYFEDIKRRREPPRAYSLSSAPHEPHLAITVKEEKYLTGVTKYAPLLSPVLVRNCPPGTRLSVTVHAGPYVLKPDLERHTDHVVHICAGSGIVPNMSMIRHALERRIPVRHTLLYGNRTWRDVIFRRDLELLMKQYPRQLRVIHALSREVVGPAGDVVSGHVDEALLRGAITDASSVLVYVCGPAITANDREAAEAYGFEARPRFTELTCATLARIGVPADRIFTESYYA